MVNFFLKKLKNLKIQYFARFFNEKIFIQQCHTWMEVTAGISAAQINIRRATTNEVDSQCSNPEKGNFLKKFHTKMAVKYF